MHIIERVSISVFFYGALSLLVLYIYIGSSTGSTKGVFALLFSVSISIFVYVFSFLRVDYFLARPDPPIFHRRRGFSNRVRAVTFAVAIINFFLSGLYAGIEVFIFVLFVRNALVLNIDYPLSKKLELINQAKRKFGIVQLWSLNLPVSRDLLLLDSASTNARVEVLFSDLTVIWRAWALFQEGRRILLIPFILWVTAVGE